MVLPKNLPDALRYSKKELLNILIEEEYGKIPKAPLSISAEILSEDKAFCSGFAPLIRYNLKTVTENGEFSFPLNFVCPDSKEALPCFILINFESSVPSKYYPAEEIADNGFAVISINYNDISSDDGDFSNGLAGVVFKNGRKPEDCGKIGLWTWGVLRAFEFACSLPQIDHEKICVVGHSRLGKTALLAGALEERFFAAMSNCSGCCGSALFRDKKGEKIDFITGRFPYWFKDSFKNYAEKDDQLPFDQHFLIAANIPHYVYVASGNGDVWADPRAELLGCVAASEYYEKHTGKGFIYDESEVSDNCSFTKGNICYHRRPGKHYLSRKDWHNYMNFIKSKI